MNNHISLVLVLVCTGAIEHAVSNSTFYIVPSEESPCPEEVLGELCLTLESYISNPDPGQNVTLELLPGDHVINSTLSVSEKESFTMRGTNATLHCTDQLRFNSSNLVSISGLNFNDCSSEVAFVAYFTLQGCDFRDSSLKMHFTEGTITRITFHDLGIGTEFGPESGALSISNSTVRVDGSTFSDCKTTGEAPAVHSRSSALTVERSTFENNIHRRRDSSFLSPDAQGGAINLDNGTLIINGSSFTGNFAKGFPSSPGGAVYTTNAIFEVHDSSFLDNRADGMGGAIFAGGGSSASFHMYNSVFSSNFAQGSGGAVCSGDVAIDRSNFTNNTANFDGGAVFARSMTLSKSVFVGNRLGSFGGRGGTIHVSGNVISIYQAAFSESASRFTRGGVIYSRGRSANISLVETTFSGNSAAICGVLEIEDGTLRHLVITRSSFIANRAFGNVTSSSFSFTIPGRGGGVLCTSRGDISVTNSTFSSNSAAGDAGVFEVEGGTVQISGSEFRNNTADGNGGVVFASANGIYTIVNTSFTGNQAGRNGGAIYGANSMFEVQESGFFRNSATDAGGAINIRQSTLDLIGSEFVLNTASLGGAVGGCNNRVRQVFMDQLLTRSENSTCTFYDDHSELITSTTSSLPTMTFAPTQSVIETTPTPTQPVTMPTNGVVDATPSPTATIDISSKAVTTPTPTAIDPSKTDVSTTPTRSEADTTPTSSFGMEVPTTPTRIAEDVAPTRSEAETTPTPIAQTPTQPRVTTTPTEDVADTTTRLEATPTPLGSEADVSTQSTPTDGMVNLVVNLTLISFSLFCICIIV